MRSPTGIVSLGRKGADSTHTPMWLVVVLTLCAFGVLALPDPSVIVYYSRPSVIDDRGRRLLTSIMLKFGAH